MDSLDYAFGRLMTHQITALSVVIGTPVVIQPNNQRVAINIAVAGLVIGGATFSTVSVDDIPAFQLTTNIHFIHLDMFQFGRIPTRKFTIASSSGTIPMGLIETFLPEQYLEACSCQFKTEYAKWLKLNSPRP